ncbi:MAG: FAD:protein FMN transferase [Bacteriovoracaceae bacterium]|nr:FAD:protein FMN transferase [Bacteriovoracaceae bacterium]
MKKTPFKAVIIKALALLGLFFITGCNKSGELVHLTGRTMGTQYNIKYYSSSQLSDSKKVQAVIDELLLKVNKEMSTYLKESEISYFNQTDRLGWLKISPDFFLVSKYALELAEETEGVFDPTIGPLVNLWGFGPGGSRKVPKEQDIAAAKKRVGFDKVSLNEKTSEIKKKVPGVYLDLSSLAKGFGVDKVAMFLESKGSKIYMVEIGGEVRTLGKKLDGVPWRIAIEAPHPESLGESYQRILKLDSMSLATSGSYRNFFMEDGKKYSHTIDVHSGRPVTNVVVSVSVAHKSSCMKADALATALMAMGLEKGFTYAQKEGLAAYFVYRDVGQEGRVFATKETSFFKDLFSTKNVSEVP